MPQVKESRCVLNELRGLSVEADHIIQKTLQTHIDAWFLEFKEAVLKITECKSKNEYTEFNFVTNVLGEKRQIIATNSPVDQRGHVHKEKQTTVSSKPNQVDTDKEKHKLSALGNNEMNHELKTDIVINNKNENEEKVSSAVVINVSAKKECNESNKNDLERCVYSSVKKPEILLLTPVIKVQTLCNQTNNSHSSQQLKETPLMNRTFNRVLDKTIVLNSGSSNSNSIQKVQMINTVNSNSPMKTRQSFKRKSSSNKTRSNKRQKLDGTNNHLAGTLHKTAHSKHAVVEKNFSTLKSASNLKCAVIMPSMPVKPISVQKEKQILEEIKKKEEKADKNLKKILAERQMKAEENKKKREEKREKTLLKRLKLEKEKEERLEKRDVEQKNSQLRSTKEQVKKAPVMKTRVKELIEQSAKEGMSGPLSAKQDINVANDLTRTPTSKLNDSDNYDMTPIPDSSIYESDDEKPSGKPIPLWAQGLKLKSAIVEQFFYPTTDPEKIFGCDIKPPDLTEIFGVSKKRYKKRTSSAVWNSPPGFSIRH